MAATSCGDHMMADDMIALDLETGCPMVPLVFHSASPVHARYADDPGATPTALRATSAR